MMSPGIAALVKGIKNHEVRGEGVPSEARRAVTLDEFRLLLRIAESHVNSFEYCLRLPTMMKFQLHLIARIDDTAHVKACNFKVHPEFEFALSVRLRWTKNCLEERDAPQQIILGAMDPDICLVIAALSIYLQFTYELTNAKQSEYLFCDIDEDPISCKKQVSALLNSKALKSDEWLEHQHTEGNDDNDSNNCGTHSFRKMACTLARLAGRNQDEVDCRGRWRDTQRISDRYTSISLPFIDAHVASCLCIGGAAKYVCKDGSNVSDHWLVTEFVPHTAEKLGHRTAIVLGKALLFCLMDVAIMLTIPVHLRTQLKQRYALIQVLPEAVNPIDRTRIDVHQHGGKLHIDPVAIIAGGGVIAVGDAQAAILAQNQAIRARLEELFTTQRNNNEALLQRFGTLQRVVSRFANRPIQVNRGFVQRRVIGGDNEQPDNENDRTTN